MNKVFRGKDTKGNWVQGALVWQEIANCIGPAPNPLTSIIMRDPERFADWGLPFPTKQVWVDPNTLGISTGVLDADGEMVFTGDIIYSSVGNFQGFVSQEQAQNGTDVFYVQWYKDGELCAKQPLAAMDVTNGYPKIIGNLWDTPELLQI